MNKLTKAFPAGDGKKDGKKDDDFDVMSVPGEVKAVKKKPEEADRLKAYDIREIDVFFDTFKAMKAAGIPLPPGVSDKDVEELGTNFMEHFLGGFVDAATESISGTSTATTVKRLFTGRFIGDLLEVMDSRVQKPLDDEYSIKLGLFSGHDTTIGPLLTGMGLFNGERRAWPKFGANVTFELFENHVGALKAENDHFVRVKYNGVPMKLPFCQKQGAHFVGDPNLCSYKTFNNAMSLLVSKNHKEECRL
ncbi:phosphoglycerate mutase-like protein [Rhizoclosmatium globosum]|uniref:Phosphoglycerate mutase-like protein n=1 Tax=Rhizoclosmatium globosum TaxID=329046 RepID=A0A1Y2D3Q7_9FUNG|nr:phosphoglycerate mutase-like protein [Rhizoclosmatium globosum]|eukprot:ORY53736.1 phosphoglycerate mutase-like protein [Rhizoclosmatium globosum]